MTGGWGGEGEGEVELAGLGGVERGAGRGGGGEGVVGARRGWCGVGVKAAFDGGERALGGDVADDDEGHVGGAIPAVKEGLHGGAVEAQDGVAGADDGPAVGVIAIGEGEERLGGLSGGVVFAAADLFKDDLALAVELVGVEGGSLDGVAEDVEAGLEGAAGEGGVIDGVVKGGVGVDVSAGGFDGARDLADAVSGGALEEHVLVDVCEALFAGLLVGAADADHDGHGDDGCGVAGLEEESQSVVEGLVDDLHGAPGA